MMPYVWLIPLAPLVASILCIALCLDKRTSPLAHIPVILGLAVSAAVSIGLIVNFPGAGSCETIEGYRWLSVGTLEIPINLRVDSLSTVQIAVVTVVSLMVAIYSSGYMKGDPGYARYFALFSGFVFSMSMLVLASNLLVLYIFWEGVGLCSYLLIGYWFDRPSAAKAATKAFLVNRIADCGFLLGILLLWLAVSSADVQSATQVGAIGQLDFDHLFSVLPKLAESNPWLLTSIGFLLLIGAIGKSAQFPFHVWLPDAMEGPTPVSALIHAATMVTAGVYLMARMAPLLETTPTVLLVAGSLGAITALLAALIALFQDDLKRVLAYSTVSQLGFMFLAIGSGAGEGMIQIAAVSALFHMLTHAFFKALLFLSAGNVMHAMGDVIDMRRFSGLRTVLPWTHICFLIGAAALAGLPPLAGFWSKESVLGSLAVQLDHKHFGTIFLVWLVIGLITSMLTATYTIRAYVRTFLGELKLPEEAGHHPHEASFGMLIPMFILAVGSLIAGASLGPTEWLIKFVEPLPFVHAHAEHHHAGTWLLVASVLAVLIGLTIGWLSCSASSAASKAGGTSASLWSKFATVARERFYLDEFFAAILVWPLIGYARLVDFVDNQLIDDFCREIASIPRRAGEKMRVLQSGLVQNYAIAIAVGVLILVILVTL